MNYTIEQIENAVKSKGYVWFDGANDYDVNIIGVRNLAPGKVVTNVFDDTITVSYKANGEWIFKQWENTTDPGKRAMLEFTNPLGVARLVEGQYRGSHQIGLHKGQYQALTQLSPLKVYRDNNKNMIYDENKTEVGIFGINIHHAGEDSILVENWSEGCQVFKRQEDFNEFMEIIKQAASINGNSFTYTLITSNDIS